MACAKAPTRQLSNQIRQIFIVSQRHLLSHLYFKIIIPVCCGSLQKNEIQFKLLSESGFYYIEHAKKSPTRDLCICQKYYDYRVSAEFLQPPK